MRKKGLLGGENCMILCFTYVPAGLVVVRMYRYGSTSYVSLLIFGINFACSGVGEIELRSIR